MPKTVPEKGAHSTPILEHCCGTSRFHLIADPNLINAFALPAGHVCVGQGLVDRMRLAQAQAVITSDRLDTNKPLKQFHVQYEITRRRQ